MRDRLRRYGPASALFVLVAGLVLGAAALFDAHVLRHGVQVRWQARIDGDLRTVAETTEHRPQFPNERRALSRYVQGWDFARDGIPADLFGFEAKVRGRLVVPEGGREVYVVARPRADVRLDGASFRSGTRVAAGAHPFEAAWSGEFTARQIGLETWFCRGPTPTPSSSPLCEQAPTSAFRLSHGGGAGFWSLAAALALGLGALGVWWLLRPISRRRLVGGRILGALALATLVALGLGLRLFDYDVMPDFRENGDELFATWNGWSLLESGETRGWSLWPHVYGARVEHARLEYFGMDWNLVQPYFEHPPLTHLLVGAAAHLGGAEHFAHAKLAHTRLVPVLLVIPTLLLLFGVGRRVDPHGPAPWLAVLLYATMPTIVLQTRVIKEEALLGPLSLGAIYALLIWRERKTMTPLLVAAFLAGLATWAKITGFAFVPAVVALVLAEGRVREGMLAGLVGCAAGASVLLFGAAIDWDTFVFAQRHQGTRPLHFNIFSRWFDVTLINHSVIGRGWMIFLWLGTAASHARRKLDVSSYVVVPLVFYLAAITIGTGNWTFGWYAVPLYPWLCLGAGRFLADLWAKPDLFRGFLASVFLGMYTLNFAVEPAYMKVPDHWPSLRVAIMVITTLLLAPYGLVQALRSVWTERLARGALVLLLAGFVGISARFVVKYEVFYDTYKDFDRDVYFDR